MWDKDYYHDKALYGQGVALINQARRDTAKINASTKSTYVGPLPRPRSSGGKTNIKDVLLIGAIVVVFSFLLPIIQWYVSDTRNYIATGAMIIPLFAVWIRRRLQTRLPMLPEMVSVASLAVVYIYVCDDCLLATDNILGFAYLPALGALVGSIVFLIFKRSGRSTAFAESDLRYAIGQSFLIAGLIILTPLLFDALIMGALKWMGIVAAFEPFTKQLGITEGQLTRAFVGIYFAVAAFGVCEARKLNK